MSRKQDPVLIIFQIVSLQCLWYFGMGVSIFGSHMLSGLPLNLDQMFSLERPLTARTELGSQSLVVLAMASVIGAFLLRNVVEKSRKCLDFSVTCFFIHMAISVAYSASVVPHAIWWIVHGLALLFMVVLGEYLCSRHELREIPLVT